MDQAILGKGSESSRSKSTDRSQDDSTKKPTIQLPRVTIRFAGDSGDGMQLTGTQFSDTSALMGNDISTLPDYPSEIRAPAGTLAGVSGYQIQFFFQRYFHPR